MTLVLYYKIGKNLIPFSNKLHLSEYYISGNSEDYKIFIKGTSLPITNEEFNTLSSSNFEITLQNGIVLFTKNEVNLSQIAIHF